MKNFEVIVESISGQHYKVYVDYDKEKSEANGIDTFISLKAINIATNEVWSEPHRITSQWPNNDIKNLFEDFRKRAETDFRLHKL